MWSYRRKEPQSSYLSVISLLNIRTILFYLPPSLLHSKSHPLGPLGPLTGRILKSENWKNLLILFQTRSLNNQVAKSLPRPWYAYFYCVFFKNKSFILIILLILLPCFPANCRTFRFPTTRYNRHHSCSTRREHSPRREGQFSGLRSHPTVLIVDVYLSSVHRHGFRD